MGPFLVGLFCVLAVTAAVSAGVLYWQFTRWPPRVWRLQLDRHLASLSARRGRIDSDATNDEQRLAQDYFRRLLCNIPVARLDAFPGIGPATLARLSDAGLRHLGLLVQAQLDGIEGIGPSRAADLRKAIGKLVAEARGRFDAGACAEAQEYREQVARLRQSAHEQEQVRRRQLAAIDDAIRATNDLQMVANLITFSNFVFNRRLGGMVDGILAKPFPEPHDVDAELTGPSTVKPRPPLAIPVTAGTAGRTEAMEALAYAPSGAGRKKHVPGTCLKPWRRHRSPGQRRRRIRG